MSGLGPLTLPQLTIRDRTGLFISFRGSLGHSYFVGAKGRGVGISSADANARLNYELHHDGGNGKSHKKHGSDFHPIPLTEEEELLNYDTIIEMDMLPPQWADTRLELDQVLISTQTLIRQLDNVCTKHLLPGFDIDAKRAEEREIEYLTSRITDNFRECQQKIKEIGRGKTAELEQKMAKNMQISLAQRVQDESREFRRKQSNYLKKLKELHYGGAYIEEARPDLEETMLISPSSKQGSMQMQQHLLQDEQDQASDQAFAIREREIESIAKGVVDIADIFKDLQNIVIEQGSIIDRIDYNVEMTATHVRDANVELQTATKYQKRSSKKLIILFLCLLVAFLLCLIFYRSSGKKQSQKDPSNLVVSHNINHKLIADQTYNLKNHNKNIYNDLGNDKNNHDNSKIHSQPHKSKSKNKYTQNHATHPNFPPFRQHLD